MNSEHFDQSASSTSAPAFAVLGRLSEQGYSITGQRRTLVELIMSRHNCFTAEDLLHDLEGSRVKVGRATVFRTLELLVRIGCVSRVRDAERMAYTACGTDHHHHLVCSNCGQVLHLEGCPVAHILDDLKSRTGYRIQRHSLEVAGICPSCQR